MHVVVALTKRTSYEKRDRMLSLLGPIAHTTLANEPECLAYAWFRSDVENAVPDRYKSEHALSQTHRSTPEYKAFRSVVIPEGITESPTDLRPLTPAGIGYLSLGNDEIAQFGGAGEDEVIIVVRRFHTADSARREDVKRSLSRVVEKLLALSSSVEGDKLRGVVKSFWCLEYAPDLEDGTVVSFERYENRMVMERVAALLRDDL
ncbi:hypothetical protein V502_10233 [Pseudogymnoascus sp. VKM F-4520 (FW-2644)]|nr:hypothetical protein V502_10233 [Pseudogymnoascus sp. VKM F-4520 (FW-2644)]